MNQAELNRANRCEPDYGERPSIFCMGFMRYYLEPYLELLVTLWPPWEYSFPELSRPKNLTIEEKKKILVVLFKHLDNNLNWSFTPWICKSIHFLFLLKVVWVGFLSFATNIVLTHMQFSRIFWNVNEYMLLSSKIARNENYYNK